MTVVMGLICGILTAFAPCEAPAAGWIKDARAVTNGECTVIAVVTEPICLLSEKRRCLTEYAERAAEETGTEVILTEDFLSYMKLVRMEKHGPSEREMLSLLRRIGAIEKECYICRRR